MAIIYTYPKLSNPTGSELVLISDTDNKTKQVAISDINDLVDCVRTLNGFSGQVNIVGGDNITVDPITGTNQIQINSDVDASGLNGELSYFAGDGKTLRGQDLLTYDGTRLFLSNYFWHKDNVTGNNAFFGFNADNSFLVYLDEGAQERISIADDSFRMFTGKTTKIAGYSDSVAIFNEMITKAQPEPESQAVIRTTERGFKVSTTYKSGTAVDSDLGFGGQIQFMSSQDSGKYVGLMGPITEELTANYNLMLPNQPGQAGQLLAVGATAGGVPPNMYRKLEWIDGSEAVGVTQLTAGEGIKITPSSGVGVVEVELTGGRGEGCGDVFKTVKVQNPSGDTDQTVASGCDDELILKAGSNVSLSLDAGRSEITIASSAGGCSNSINKISTGGETITFTGCDQTLKLAGSGGTSVSASGDTVTISSATGCTNSIAEIATDSGTYKASGCGQAIDIKGTTGASTPAYISTSNPTGGTIEVGWSDTGRIYEWEPKLVTRGADGTGTMVVVPNIEYLTGTVGYAQELGNIIQYNFFMKFILIENLGNIPVGSLGVTHVTDRGNNPEIIGIGNGLDPRFISLNTSTVANAGLSVTECSVMSRTGTDPQDGWSNPVYGGMLNKFYDTSIDAMWLYALGKTSIGLEFPQYTGQARQWQQGGQGSSGANYEYILAGSFTAMRNKVR